jgi:AbrB family looped-hinge helix DNA binding protein
MTEEVVVTRKGQTTVPVRFRKKYGIYEGTRLQVEDTGNGILRKKMTSTLELIGSGSKYASVEEMKKLLDGMRAEEESLLF